MKVAAATLVLVTSIVGIASGSLLSRGEGALWIGFVLIISVCGYVWASRDRTLLPEARQEELRHMGYIPSVTSAMSPEKTKLFCALLAVWLFCLCVRLVFHFYA